MGGLSSLAGNLTGGIIGTSDTEAAAQQANVISEEAKKEILGELDSAWGDIESWLTPFIDTGNEALTQYKSAIGAEPNAPVFDNFTFDFTQMEQNPAYQFVRDQGMQAVERQQAATGNLGSGNRMTAMADYTAGLASTEYGNEFNRQLQTYNTNNNAQLMNFETANNQYDRNMGNLNYLTTLGVNSTNNLANMRNQFATQRSSAYSNRAAEATAAALIPAQEKSSFVNNIIGAGASATGSYYGAQ